MFAVDEIVFSVPFIFCWQRSFNLDNSWPFLWQLFCNYCRLSVLLFAELMVNGSGSSEFADILEYVLAESSKDKVQKLTKLAYFAYKYKVYNEMFAVTRQACLLRVITIPLCFYLPLFWFFFTVNIAERLSKNAFLVTIDQPCLLQLCNLFSQFSTT